MPEPKQFLVNLRRQTDTVLLSFSRGKDSLACWLVLQAHGFKVVPFHMELIPGMQFIEDSLRYYESVFATHIYRTLHPATYGWIRTLVAQPPWTVKLIEKMNLPRYKMDDVAQGVLAAAGLPENTWHAIGTRAADSAPRRVLMTKYAGIDAGKHKVFPVWDMNKAELFATIKTGGVKLPIDYRLFGRSWDGLDWWYLEPVKQHFPEDYARILQLFPMMDVELVRKGFRHAHQESLR